MKYNKARAGSIIIIVTKNQEHKTMTNSSIGSMHGMVHQPLQIRDRIGDYVGRTQPLLYNEVNCGGQGLVYSWG